ncbi:hypothetical protein WDZ17_12660 [Pseudokineococcus basanitobsidens]|uniref:Uncharacterized protein n=1 Tax=Pseudokineococcus basanitobsidens TaxID=1926649 RepID=A0ABU8RMG5_9ACTN
MTIATLPSGSGLAMVGRDVELVRATLLYADEIEIVSPAAQMLDSVLEAARNPDGMLDLLLEAGAGLLDGEHSEDQLRQTQQVMAAVRSPEWRAKLAQSPPDTEEGAALHDFFAKTEETLREASAQMKATVAELDARSGLTALQPAIDQGIVTIHRAGYLGAEGSDEVVARFVDPEPVKPVET